VGCSPTAEASRPTHAAACREHPRVPTARGARNSGAGRAGRATVTSIAMLDPDVVVRTDRSAASSGASTASGAPAVAKQALAFSGRARFAQIALVNGAVGIVVAPRGRLLLVLGFTITRGKIVEIDVVADPERIRQLDLAVLND
jgi:hypothetical protein